MSKISCEYCNMRLKIRKFTPGFEYICPNCNGLVYKSGASILNILITATSTLIVFCWMISTNILSVTLFDTKERSILDSLLLLYQNDFPVSSFIFFVTVIMIPICMIFLIYFIILGAALKSKKTTLHKAVSLYNTIKEWNMTEVYLLSILIGMIKLNDITVLEIQNGLWITFIFVFMFYITVVFFNPYDIIDTVAKKKTDENSILKTFLYLILAVIFLIPANLLPIMPTYKFGVEYTNTIFGGLLGFWQDKDYFVASVIFFTSICIPFVKIVGLFILILMAKYDILKRYKKIMTIYYRITNNWGKYSMLDVFVVVIVASFIQYDQIVRAEAGTAILPFTLVVFFTMMASKSFDIRLIWEKN